MRYISGVTGNVIPCCWTDCQRDGTDDHEAVVHEPGRNVHYLFCSHAHLMLWTNSHKDMGNFAAGEKSAGRYVSGWRPPAGWRAAIN